MKAGPWINAGMASAPESRRWIVGLLLAACLGLSGCYSLPKQSGTWIVEIETKVFYDSSLEPIECVGADIVQGPRLKNLIPSSVFVVKPDMRCYQPGEIDATKARIKGTIVSEFPIHPKTGKPVTHKTQNPEEGFSVPWVLKVKELELL